MKGKTYTEIRSALNTDIPKSTLSDWCRDIILPEAYYQRVENLNRVNLNKGRSIAAKLLQERQKFFYKELHTKNAVLLDAFNSNTQVRKITLAVLYLAEGSKTKRGSLMFGNSDPLIIQIFLRLLRESYDINESKFRCTVQCRADQRIPSLEKFWTRITSISLKQFYMARVDKRTIGQKSRKTDYKGVCRIDYFSSIIDLELKYIAQMILH